MRRLAVAAALVIAATTSQPTVAGTTFIATIDGASNVPARDVPGMGTAVMVLNDAQTELSYDIQLSGLVAAEVASHFHNAGARDQGPIVHNLPLGTHKVGVWSISPGMVTELFARRIYINIHSTLYISGELRGNVVVQVVPAEGATWGNIKALYR
jgi:hypothetical protein